MSWASTQEVRKEQKTTGGKYKELLTKRKGEICDLDFKNPKQRYKTPRGLIKKKISKIHIIRRKGVGGVTTEMAKIKNGKAS